MRILLAPVPVTPTKCLTPSHVKLLLWCDVMARATSLIHTVDTYANRVVCDTSLQTLRFWWYLDTRYTPAELHGVDDAWVAARYVACHREPLDPPPAALSALRDRVEREGFVHPSARRVLAAWGEQLAALGCAPEPLTHSHPLAWSLDALYSHLAQSDALLDTRALDGCTCLDATRAGIPLRVLVDRDGLPNYLAQHLRDLVPLSAHYDRVVLVCDESIRRDFELLAQRIAAHGTPASVIALSRVPIGGVAAASREGGWEACTLARMLSHVGGDTPAARLAMRLYHVGHGARGREDFDYARLDRAMQRARRLLVRYGAVAPCRDATREAVASLVAREDGDVLDPYRVLSALQGERLAPGAAAGVLQLALGTA